MNKNRTKLINKLINIDQGFYSEDEILIHNCAALSGFLNMLEHNYNSKFIKRRLVTAIRYINYNQRNFPHDYFEGLKQLYKVFKDYENDLD